MKITRKATRVGSMPFGAYIMEQSRFARTDTGHFNLNQE